MEYTDAFSAPRGADQDLTRFGSGFREGRLGEGFEIFRRERMATVKGRRAGN
jgi:hypothetical protein